MKQDNSRKREPWRIVVFLLAVACIVFLWVKKDIASIYATAPAEQILPMILTTLAVSLLKVAVIALAVLLVKWIIGKCKKK